MKNLIFLLFAIAFIGCSKDNPVATQGSYTPILIYSNENLISMNMMPGPYFYIKDLGIIDMRNYNRLYITYKILVYSTGYYQAVSWGLTQYPIDTSNINFQNCFYIYSGGFTNGFVTINDYLTNVHINDTLSVKLLANISLGVGFGYGTLYVKDFFIYKY